jgi:hypothetical protein
MHVVFCPQCVGDVSIRLPPVASCDDLTADPFPFPGGELLVQRGLLMFHVEEVYQPLSRGLAGGLTCGVEFTV